MMNPEIKALWLAALRSGEYKQGTACLKNMHCEYCCLGVLTDLYIKATNGEWIKHESQRYSLKGDGGLFYLADEVALWAGLTKEEHESDFNPVVIVSDEIKTRYQMPANKTNVASLNDLRVPFNVIADIIEGEKKF
jgi:hypothetical protein